MGPWITDKLIKSYQLFARTMGVPIVNDTGSDIPVGKLVFITGFNVPKLKFSISLADANVANAQAAWITTEAIKAGNSSVLAKFFRVERLNTAAGAAGALVYEDTTAGGWTLTNPQTADKSARAHIVGYVEVSSATVGVIVFDLFSISSIVAGTRDFAAGFLSADALGRALMASNFFDAATVLAKFAASSFDFTAVSSVFAAASIPATKLQRNVLQSATIALTSAQVKALRAAPQVLVAAPGAGQVIEFVSANVRLDYGTNVFTVGAGDDLAVKFKDGTGPSVSENIETTGFLDQTTDIATSAIPKKDAIVTKANCENQPLVLHGIGGAEIAGNAANDSVVRLDVSFRVHSTVW